MWIFRFPNIDAYMYELMRIYQLRFYVLVCIHLYYVCIFVYRYIYIYYIYEDKIRAHYTAMPYVRNDNVVKTVALK